MAYKAGPPATALEAFGKVFRAGPLEWASVVPKTKADFPALCGAVMLGLATRGGACSRPQWGPPQLLENFVFRDWPPEQL